MDATPTHVRRTPLEPGDTVRYRGYLIIGLEPEESISRMDEADADWNQELSDFLSRELDATPAQREAFGHIRADFDAEYTRPMLALEAEVQRVFGTEHEVVMEGPIERQYRDAQARYDDRVRALFGESGRSRLRRFRQEHAERAHRRYDVGWYEGH